MTVADEMLMRQHVNHLIKWLEESDVKRFAAGAILMHKQRQNMALSLQSLHEMYLDQWKQLTALRMELQEKELHLETYKTEVKELIQEFKNERKFEKYISRIDGSTGDIKR